MSTHKIKGLRTNVRSPGSTVNAEHHDETGAHKGIDGEPLTIDEIIPDSTVSTPVRNHGLIRIFNSDAGVQYIWSGKEGDEPGTVDVTTGLALEPGKSQMFFIGYSDDIKKSMMVKTSNSAVQVAIIRS